MAGTLLKHLVLDKIKMSATRCLLSLRSLKITSLHRKKKTSAALTLHSAAALKTNTHNILVLLWIAFSPLKATFSKRQPTREPRLTAWRKLFNHREKPMYHHVGMDDDIPDALSTPFFSIVLLFD